MEVSDKKQSKGKLIASGIIPFAFLIVLVVYIFGPGSDVLDLGVPLPEITMEKIISMLQILFHFTIRTTQFKLTQMS